MLCLCILDNLSSLLFLAIVRKSFADNIDSIKNFGKYVADCLPKYVQAVQMASKDELEILVAPQGIRPVLSFLKEHQNAQYTILADLTALDVPSRPCRFEVCSLYLKTYSENKGFFVQKIFKEPAGNKA